MKLHKGFSVLAVILTSSTISAGGQQPKWIAEGPNVEDKELFLELPMKVFGNQLLIEVEVGGVPRQFLFDTGSPSMMSAALAAELKLEVIDRIKGRDSHGAVIDTEIVQSDLTLGGTTFYKVPIFVADFPKPPKCLFDGVLGSEMLPLCAWQIDVPESTVRCSTMLTKLEHIKKAKQQRLHDFGYPHAPILDVRFTSKAKSKVLFDTGSPDFMAISPPDFEGAERSGGIARTRAGTGSIGGSIGGLAPEKDQLRVELDIMRLGNVELKNVGAILRDSPPSLIGASVFDHFVVTLDSSNATAYFDQYRNGPFARQSYGFSLSFEEEQPKVSLVWDESPAESAGLKVGQRVTAINGQPTDASCDGIRKTMRAMSDGNTIAVEWEGGEAELTRQPWVDQ
ncbi:MAG: aspartyl protease family protein [Wenzhouxiangellaceae bacterium]